MVTQRSWQFLKLYNQYSNNILPKGGGWLDQPNVFAESVELISSERTKIQQEKARKNGRKS